MHLVVYKLHFFISIMHQETANEDVEITAAQHMSESIEDSHIHAVTPGRSIHVSICGIHYFYFILCAGRDHVQKNNSRDSST
jgi:hypothetical protein